jgi:hypothetical protein
LNRLTTWGLLKASLAFLAGLLGPLGGLRSPQPHPAPSVRIGGFGIELAHRTLDIRGSAARVCTSQPVRGLWGWGTVFGATRGATYQVSWWLNGHKVTSFGSAWSLAGTAAFTFGGPTAKTSLAQGRWELDVYQAGRLLGRGFLVLRVSGHCPPKGH